MSTDMTGWCALCRAGSHNTHNAALGGICVGCACPVTAAVRPSVTDNARAVREAAMDLYRALRRANPDAWAEVDEVEDWAYWDDIVRTAQVALAAGRAEAWAEGHRTGWEHCQDGNYGDDYWDDPTPNPYTAAARRSNTVREGQDMRPEDAPQDAQYSVVVHQLDCPCGDGNNRFAEFKDGCRVDVYPGTPPQAGGFGPAVGYVQTPPKVSMLTAEELFGNKGGAQG